MENFYAQMMDYSIEIEEKSSKIKLLFSLIAFALLIIYMRLISIHPHSVCYYFLAGFNVGLFVVITHSRSISKRRIQHAKSLKARLPSALKETKKLIAALRQKLSKGK